MTRNGNIVALFDRPPDPKGLWDIGVDQHPEGRSVCWYVGFVTYLVQITARKPLSGLLLSP